MLMASTGPKAPLALAGHRTPYPRSKTVRLLDRTTLDEIILRKTTFPEAITASRVKIEADGASLMTLTGCLDEFERIFPVVEPKAG